MPTYGWTCAKCDTSVDIVRPMAESSVPPNLGELSKLGIEEECDHVWEKPLVAPQVLRKSFLDGQRSKGTSKASQDFANLKRAVNLEVEMANHRKGSEERREIAKEIRELKGQKPIGAKK